MKKIALYLGMAALANLMAYAAFAQPMPGMPTPTVSSPVIGVLTGSSTYQMPPQYVPATIPTPTAPTQPLHTATAASAATPMTAAAASGGNGGGTQTIQSLQSYIALLESLMASLKPTLDQLEAARMVAQMRWTMCPLNAPQYNVIRQAYDDAGIAFDNANDVYQGYQTQLNQAQQQLMTLEMRLMMNQ